MQLTSTQRRKARIGKDTFHGAQERWDATMERLVIKRCKTYGVEYAAPDTEYYDVDSGAWQEALWDSHDACRSIRWAFKALIPNQAYVNACMERIGLRYLGAGSFRWVYEDKDGLVYKFFNNREYNESRNDNKNDVAVSRVWHKHRESAPAEVRDGFYIPVMRMAYGIVVSEKAPAPADDQPSCWSADRPLANFMRQHGWNVNDTHGGNMWWDGVKWCYVDLGHFQKV